MSFASTLSEEKENGEHNHFPRSKLSPDMRYSESNTSSGRGSPARGFRSTAAHRDDGDGAGSGGLGVGGSGGIGRERPSSTLSGSTQAGGAGGAGGGQGGAESWKRAAEVTSQLRARIEQMKVSERFCNFGFGFNGLGASLPVSLVRKLKW